MKGDCNMNNEYLAFNENALTLEEREYFEIQKDVSNLIIRLIKRRLDLNLSQRDLAKMTNIKQPMIARIESGDTIPRVDTLIRMIKALDLELSFDAKIYETININITINYNSENNDYKYAKRFDNSNQTYYYA